MVKAKAFSYMNKYTNILSNIDIEIDNLVMDYSRNERRWNLPVEEIPIRQEQIRTLKHNRIKIKEQMWTDYPEGVPTNLLVMLKPIMLRRRYSVEKQGSIVIPRNDANFDGGSFTFQISAEDYKPKHLRGFWSCPGCMLEPKFDIPEFMDYNRQIEWCPKFLMLLKDKGPLEYEKILKRANPDIPICYAGLLHAELQTTATEVKLVKQCDTCSYCTVESKQLVTDSLDGYEIGVDAAKGSDSTTITCKCEVCQEIIFEEFADRCTQLTTNGQDRELTPEFDAMINQHHLERH